MKLSKSRMPHRTNREKSGMTDYDNSRFLRRVYVNTVMESQGMLKTIGQKSVHNFSKSSCTQSRFSIRIFLIEIEENSCTQHSSQHDVLDFNTRPHNDWGRTRSGNGSCHSDKWRTHRGRSASVNTLGDSPTCRLGLLGVPSNTSGSKMERVWRGMVEESTSFTCGLADRGDSTPARKDVFRI